MGMAQNPRQDAIADRGLVVAPAAAGSGQISAQAMECSGLMLVVPQDIQRRIVMLQRRAEGLDGKREDLMGELEAPAGRQSRIGQQRGRRRASR